MNPAAIWQFIAGDSRLAPLAVFLAVAVAFAMVRAGMPHSVTAATFPLIVALGLAAAVFERR